MRQPSFLRFAAVLITADFMTGSSLAFARAGGGSNHGGGGILAIFLAPFILIYGWYVNKRIQKKNLKTEALLGRLAGTDSIWNEETILAMVRKSFVEIQDAWCRQDLEALKGRLHESLFAQWRAQIELMKHNGERDMMEELSIDDVKVVEVKNYKNDNEDSFTVCIDAEATDYTVNGDGEIISSNTSNRRKEANREKSHESFREFWTYQRVDNGWRLLRVDQEAQWRASVNAPLINEDEPFSQSN